MVDKIKSKNIYLVNAPAGSGKTTKIKNMIRKYTIDNPKDNILCITFTNRAADELIKDINSPNIHISTIHSYINEFISPFFSNKKVIDLYFQIYKANIIERIQDKNKTDSNQKYIDKYGKLDLDTIRSNLKELFYNETEFNSLYYGGLSHDDLLSFTYKALLEFPKVKQKISCKFQIIIIDEYQDTSPDVLHIFFKTVKDTSTSLYLYGDKMQQIYKIYDDGINNELSTLNIDRTPTINHRSIPAIVNLINKIYNNSNLEQKIYDKNKEMKPDYDPRIIITDCAKFDEYISGISEKYPETLALYIFNSDRFKKIGSINLYNAYGRMEEYKFNSRYSNKDVLLDNTLDNPDVLMKFLFILDKANNYWKEKKFGSFLYLCKLNKNFFKVNKLLITKPCDKISIKMLWSGIFDLYNANGTTIGQVINLLIEKKVLEVNFVEIINNDDRYNDVFYVQISELIKLSRYLSPTTNELYVSTQHGVKGESHDSVIFVAEDSKNKPLAYMYKFFEVWSKVQFSLEDFEDFYFSYYDFIKNVENELGFNIKKINKERNNVEYIIRKCNEIMKNFEHNFLFELICKDLYTSYLNKPIITNAKKCFQNNTVYGVLSAYKLFYVGCSRARKNLTILVDKAKIIKFEKEFRQKAKNVGFKI